MKILVGVDGSEGSFEAIAQASAILSPEKDHLALFYSPPHIQREIAGDYAIAGRGLSQLCDLVFIRAEIHLPGVWRNRVERIAGVGDAAAGILETAKQWGADLVVVGSRGIGRLGRIVVGSVSRKVVRGAAAPVLVARRRAHAKDWSFGRRIVVGCESVATGKEFLNLLNRFTWPTKPVVEMVHIVESVFGGPVPAWLDAEARQADVEELVKHWVRNHDERIAAARMEMQALSQQLMQAAHAVPPTVVEGSPGEEILKAAERQESDLIVIGAKPLTALGRLIGGSTCEAVLNHASCSVLVVHHPAPPHALDGDSGLNHAEAHAPRLVDSAPGG